MAHPKDTPDTQDTVTDADYIRTQLRIPRAVWDQMKIQAIHENVTGEQLTAKAFERYLASKEAIAARNRKKPAA